jgi:hypothetical protein
VDGATESVYARSVPSAWPRPGAAMKKYSRPTTRAYRSEKPTDICRHQDSYMNRQQSQILGIIILAAAFLLLACIRYYLKLG